MGTASGASLRKRRFTSSSCFPAKFDDLITALAYCVDNRIDVVNCSLGTSQVSETVT